MKLSPTGLKKVLAGTRIHEATRRKLDSWWLRRAAKGHPTVVDPETAGAALDLLTAGLPPERREALTVTFLTAVSNKCRRAELPARSA